MRAGRPEPRSEGVAAGPSGKTSRPRRPRFNTCGTWSSDRARTCRKAAARRWSCPDRRSTCSSCSSTCRCRVALRCRRASRSPLRLPGLPGIRALLAPPAVFPSAPRLLAAALLRNMRHAAASSICHGQTSLSAARSRCPLVAAAPGLRNVRAVSKPCQGQRNFAENVCLTNGVCGKQFG